MKNARRVTIFATFEQLVNILFWEVRLSSGEGVLKNDSLESLNRRFYHSPDHFLKAVIVWPWDGMNILMVIIRANDILEISWLMKTTAVTKYLSNDIYRPHVNEKKTIFIIHATAFTSTSSKLHYKLCNISVWCAVHAVWTHDILVSYPQVLKAYHAEWSKHTFYHTYSSHVCIHFILYKIL